MPTVIYPASIKTDKDKLFACYSLVEQMRLEHNKRAESFRNRLTLEPVPKNQKELEAKRKQGFIRPWCPEGFMLADTPENNSLRAKFRVYAHESKARQKQLLAERNQLIENIRWANYTSEQWKALSKLSEDEQIAIHKALFGDKNIEKVKTTKATSSVLDELKALNLDDMPEVLGADPTEDFSTYTEVDEGSDVTKTADRITFTAVETRYDTFYVYKDKTADHFNGNFEHLVKSYVSAVVTAGLWVYWGLANMVGDFYDIQVASGDSLISYWYYSAPNYYIRLHERDGANSYNDGYSNFNLSTVYFFEIERDEAVGTYGTIYNYICTGDYWDDGGTQIDTLTLALHTSKKDYRYIYGLMSYDDAASAGKTATGYVELLDLQEAGIDYPINTSCSLSLLPSISRKFDPDRGISSNLSLAASISRVFGRIRTTSSDLNLTANVSRVIAITRAVSSNLSLASTIARSRARIITTSANLSLTTTIDRVATFARVTASNLSLAAAVSKIRGWTVAVSANLSLTTTISRVVAWARATSSSLSLTTTISKLRAVLIATTSNLALTANISRVVAFARATSSNLNLTATISRVIAVARMTSSNLNLTTTVLRLIVYARTISSNLSLAPAIHRTVAFTRATTSRLNLLARVVLAGIEYFITTTCRLSLTTTISRSVGRIKTISARLSLTTTITAIIRYCNPSRIPLAAMALKRVVISRLPWCRGEEK